MLRWLNDEKIPNFYNAKSYHLEMQFPILSYLMLSASVRLSSIEKCFQHMENILSGTFKPSETTYFLVYIGFPKH